MKNNFYRQSGFTLMEVIVSLLLLAVVVLVSLSFMTAITRTYAQLNSQSLADESTGLVWTRLLRETRKWKAPVFADTNQIQFVNQQGITNTCVYTGTSLTWNGFILAESVERCAFTFYGATNGVLSPTNLASLYRIRMDMSIRKDDQTSAWNLNFYVTNRYIK